MLRGDWRQPVTPINTPTLERSDGMSKEHSSKPCISCGEIKPLSDFYAHPRMADKHLNKCKPCCKRDVRENRKANISHYHDYDSERNNHDPRRKAMMRASIRRNRAKNADKTRARSAVERAVRRGQLKQLPCEICGVLPTQAHHEDYSKPLDVRWLCHKHHHTHGHGHIVTRI